jgi:endonuclease/exonuclease/phosphatase family metal-dependent hydrolase
MSSPRRRAESPPIKVDDLIRMGALVKRRFLSLPQRMRWGILTALGICLVVGLGIYFHPTSTPAPALAPVGGTTEAIADGTGFLFCFWNAENFFDDVEDRRPTQPDKDYDAWFAQDGARVFKQKLKNLTEVLLKMNNGYGPDILALAEVENLRAAEKLRDSLNAGLKDPKLHYKNVQLKDPNGGRHIATAVITRLDVVAGKTSLLGRRQRILEVHVTANGHDLVVVASHWTSRVSSRENREGEGRSLYASNIRKRFDALYKVNPKVDFLVCGDFNDEPDDDSVVDHLKATGDINKVRAGGDNPLLLNLLADRRTEVLADPSKQKEPGTHNYRGRWFIFDQIIVSPGLLDNEGWTCDPASVRIVNNLTAITSGRKRGTPDDFGSPHDRDPLEDRGYSDHFPVTVRLKVAGAK